MRLSAKIIVTKLIKTYKIDGQDNEKCLYIHTPSFALTFLSNIFLFLLNFGLSPKEIQPKIIQTSCLIKRLNLKGLRCNLRLIVEKRCSRIPALRHAKWAEATAC